MILILALAAIIVIIVLLFGLPQPPAEVRVSPSMQRVMPGQTFTLSVIIDPHNSPIAGAQLNLAFNKSVVNVNSVGEGNLFKQNGSSTYFNSGTISNINGTVENIFGVILGPYSVSTPGTFITINFTAIASSDASDIRLSNVIVSDPTAVAVPLNITNVNISINTRPVLAPMDDRTIDEGQAISFVVIASDADNDILLYSASNLPQGATFGPTPADPSTGTFQWTPNFSQAGTYPNIHFEVTDGALTDSKNITIIVRNANIQPIITVLPENGSVFNVTDTIYLSINATDPDNDTLSYTIKIDGNQVSTSSTYNWTTDVNSSGNHVIDFLVNDGTAVVSKTVAIHINKVYPRYDPNGDGIVGADDLNLIAQHFGETVTPPYPGYDINMDGAVDIADIVLTAQHFGENT